MLFGYVRCSTAKGNEQRQVEALRNYGVDDKNIFIDKITGTAKSRPQLNELQKFLREGDTIVVSEISRLSRKVYLTFELIEGWKNNGIRFVSLRENLDTNDKFSIVTLAVLASIAEAEKEEINARCAAGREIAKREGRMGRPKADSESIELAMRLFQFSDYSIREIGNKSGLSSATIYRYANERGLRRSQKR